MPPLQLAFAAVAPRRRGPRRPCAGVVVALSMLVAACGGGLDVPPPMPPSTAPLAPLPAATIAVPISIPMARVRTLLDAALPARDSLDRAECAALGGAVCHQYVYTRDPLDVRVAGAQVDVATRLRYRGRVAAGGLGSLAACGYAPEPMRRAAVALRTELYWRADWKLATRNTALDADLLDPCRVTALRVDATPLMRRVVDSQLDRAVRLLDSIVPAVADLRPVADSLWRALQEPMPLDSAGHVWLLAQPERVAVTPVAGTAYGVGVTLVVTARPRIVLGARPAVAVRPLPALGLAAPAAGVQVPIEARLPYAELAAEVQAMLAAETAREKVRVQTVELWGAGEQLVVKLGLGGQVRGTLFLVGSPEWDAAARQVRMRDLRWSLESADALSKLKTTIGAPLVALAINRATGGGQLPLGARLDSARVALTAEMNRALAPGAVLAGGVHAMDITGVHLTPDALVVRARLDGTAQLYAR